MNAKELIEKTKECIATQCQKTQPYFCEQCGEMTHQLLVDAEFQVFRCLDCGENNTFSEGN